ncbi:hypothetical protein BJX96DRAFT_159685 [Aspergillus floccosus]
MIPRTRRHSQSDGLFTIVKPQNQCPFDRPVCYDSGQLHLQMDRGLCQPQDYMIQPASPFELVRESRSMLVVRYPPPSGLSRRLVPGIRPTHCLWVGELGQAIAGLSTGSRPDPVSMRTRYLLYLYLLSPGPDHGCKSCVWYRPTSSGSYRMRLYSGRRSPLERHDWR